jgi:hypothetical protein
MDKVGTAGIKDFELRVGGGDDLTPVDAEFTKKSQFRSCLMAPFSGKGAPEHCQLVLQLVNHFELAPGGDLQKYADENLGLDCNGFVGNFLWHGWKGNPWTDVHRGDHDMDGPDTSIDGFLDARRKNRVNQWSDINTSMVYLFIRAKETGEVNVDRSGDIGHIVVSDAGLAALPATDAGKHIGVRVVESSGHHVPPGLGGNSYTWVAEKKPKPSKPETIFRVDRGADIDAGYRKLWFIVVGVDAEPGS